MLILNEKEFIKHLYNRYNRVYTEALIEATELVRVAVDRDSAMDVLKSIIAHRVHMVSDNTAEIQDMYNRIFKRGNPRRKSTRGL